MYVVVKMEGKEGSGEGKGREREVSSAPRPKIAIVNALLALNRISKVVLNILWENRRVLYFFYIYL